MAAGAREGWAMLARAAVAAAGGGNIASGRRGGVPVHAGGRRKSRQLDGGGRQRRGRADDSRNFDAGRITKIATAWKQCLPTTSRHLPRGWKLCFARRAIERRWRQRPRGGRSIHVERDRGSKYRGLSEMSGVVKVLVVGQTPPPWHGQAIMIDRLLRGQYRARAAVSRANGIFGIDRRRGAIPPREAVSFARRGDCADCLPPRGAWHEGALLSAGGAESRAAVSRSDDFARPRGGCSAARCCISMPAAFRSCIRSFRGRCSGLFRRALFGADAAIRISHGSPPDAEVLQAKRRIRGALRN